MRAPERPTGCRVASGVYNGGVTALHRNAEISARLREVARYLEQQGASPYRVGAFSHGADTVTALPEDVGDLLARGGDEALRALPGIGESLAHAIVELVRTGRLRMLERMRGEADPEVVFTTLPGVGPELAKRIEQELHIGTLEDLELAAYDGRLARVRGVGPRRLQSLRAEVREALAHVRPDRPAPAPDPAHEPSVAELLDVDREYRERAAEGTLPRIAPRRFNPRHEAWLPVLHTERGAWHVTALFSNTERAHALGKTRDWVILYFHVTGAVELQRTVVTETHGSLVGRRVVRGREAECLALHDDQVPPAGTALRSESSRL
ncbi:helix-hairpin-helix domain-containing protein [soil metagenome]